MAKKLKKAQFGKVIKAGIKAAKETYVAAKKEKAFEKFIPKAVSTPEAKSAKYAKERPYGGYMRKQDLEQAIKNRAQRAGSNKLGGQTKSKKK